MLLLAGSRVTLLLQLGYYFFFGGGGQEHYLLICIASYQETWDSFGDTYVQAALG